MAIRDEIKAARKDLVENGTFKEKVAYFFDYYAIHTIVIAVILIFTVAFIYRQVTKPEIVFNGLLLNVLSFEEGNPVEDLESGFMDYIDMNTKEYDFSVNSSLIYKLGDDSGQTQMNDYQSSQAIMTLCSAGAVDFISSPLEFDNNIKANDIPCPDPTKPEEMKEPIPIFIDVSKCEKMANIYDYSSDTIVVAFAANAPNRDRFPDFLAYIFEE